ncbi:thioesterase family protein [Streptomyces sp. Tu 2975]|uniref:thioesterase family protein n=1 Tax=Streptomyces sp. Tu 2975 TaxID=2676871 RepID=UPI001359F9D9|nr:thioesterase family protein [Streptomyces sp. Tu 2975]QIP84220.1 thioesterase family protein [Streptomyces sp. Tu 2975]
MPSTHDTNGPGALLGNPASGGFEAENHLQGFGGFHGGLALALLTSATQSHVPDLELQSVTGRFDRSIESGFTVASSLVRAGRTSAVVTARAESDEGLHIEASAVYGRPGEPSWQPVAPAAPTAPPPDECEVFAIPPEFVPISASMQIRPVGSARPYAGGPDPELIAWVRLLEDDNAPDVLRFVFLMDALAPSYAAVLSQLVLVPTVELTVRPGAGLAKASSPWILLRARTLAASAGGWINEQIDAWDPDGTYLGAAHQLRVVRAG